jgi:hypothetical protein
MSVKPKRWRSGSAILAGVAVACISAAALYGNNFYDNSFGDQISGGVEIGENLCDGSTKCP